MSIIFVIGPAYKNLNVLLNTININRTLINTIKHIYIPTNDLEVFKYFKNNTNINNITCEFFRENQGHQLSCYNSIIAGMQMILKYDSERNDDKVIFCHEDCYLNDISLFNQAIYKLNTYDVVCREYNRKLAIKDINATNYYMNDTFLINKNRIYDTFNNLNLLDNFNSERNPENRFCEYFFGKAIHNLKIFSILYIHTTWDNTELGFYHIPSFPYNEENWDKKNINNIYNENNR